MAGVVALDPLRDIGVAGGLHALGATSADPFPATRAALEERREAGLHGGMQFTYRNPARSTDPHATMPDARTLLVGARSYNRAAPPAAERTGPVARVARYVWADDYGVLRRGLGAVADRLRADGWQAMVIADENNLVDRAAAHRAGLGWFGKSSNLLLPGHGSWFVLGSVITDAPVQLADAAQQAVPDGCGSCVRCIDGCPTGAIIAPGVVDARRCLAWSLQTTGPFPREQRVALGDRIYGCDDCQEVCPPNRREDRVGELGAPVDASAAWVPIIEMLDLSDAALMARFGHWYVPRREPRYLRRNALVVLGNTADPSRTDAAARACLVRYLADPDPMLRAHAAWAVRRLGWSDLLAPLASDDASEVRDELAAPGPPSRSA